jgi:hypothetical protein
MAAEQIEVPIPHCPHCDAELPGIGLYNWSHGIWGIFCVYCPDCLKTIHLQIAPMAVPEDPRVQIPS